MKSRRMTVTLSLLLMQSVITVIGFSIGFFQNNIIDKSVEKKEINEITCQATYFGYNTVDKLEENSELIVIGSPVKDFMSREHNLEYLELPKSSGKIVSNFSTTTEFEVEKIIKSSENFVLNESNIIEIIEPVGLEKKTKVYNKLFLEDYRELKKGSRYIIFLKKNANGQYSVINMNKGKFNFDNSDPEDNGKDVKTIGNEQYREQVTQDIQEKIQFKEKVLKRYASYLSDVKK